MNLFRRVLEAYEYRIDLKKYWKRRLYIQKQPKTFAGGC